MEEERSEYFQCLDVTQEWFERQEECNPTQLTCFKNIQYFVVYKTNANCKQKYLIIVIANN